MWFWLFRLCMWIKLNSCAGEFDGGGVFQEVAEWRERNLFFF